MEITSIMPVIKVISQDMILFARDNQMLKVWVKGSQDGRWGLTQSYKKAFTYHEA